MGKARENMHGTVVCFVFLLVGFCRYDSPSAQDWMADDDLERVKLRQSWEGM